jgi:hypothetical protein
MPWRGLAGTSLRIQQVPSQAALLVVGEVKEFLDFDG